MQHKETNNLTLIKPFQTVYCIPNEEAELSNPVGDVNLLMTLASNGYIRIFFDYEKAEESIGINDIQEYHVIFTACAISPIHLNTDSHTSKDCSDNLYFDDVCLPTYKKTNIMFANKNYTAYENKIKQLLDENNIDTGRKFDFYTKKMKFNNECAQTFFCSLKRKNLKLVTPLKKMIFFSMLEYDAPKKVLRDLIEEKGRVEEGDNRRNKRRGCNLL